MKCFRDIFVPLLLIVISSFLGSGCSPKIQAVEDLNEILNVFSEFRDAVESNNGIVAVPLVSEKSIERFQEFRDLAVSASPEELQQLPLLEQIEVLRLRYVLSGEQLQNASGSDVLRLLIDKDQLPTLLIKGSLLTQPVFQEGRCFLTIYQDTGPAKEKLKFVRDGENWKIDLPSMEYVQEKIYNGMKRKRRMSDADVIAHVAAAWGEDVELDHLWQPATATPSPLPELPDQPTTTGSEPSADQESS